MKSTTKLTFIAATLAVIGSSVAFADDPQLQNRLNAQRAQWPAAERSTTIAFYSGHRGLSGRHMVERNEAAEMRFELRDTGHGQLRGVYTTTR